MSRTQRQEREAWEATDPDRDQPLSPIAIFVLRLLAGAVWDYALTDERRGLITVAQSDAARRLAWQLGRASEGH
jgi:hypothetical protein